MLCGAADPSLDAIARITGGASSRATESAAPPSTARRRPSFGRVTLRRVTRRAPTAPHARAADESTTARALDSVSATADARHELADALFAPPADADDTARACKRSESEETAEDESATSAHSTSEAGSSTHGPEAEEGAEEVEHEAEEWYSESLGRGAAEGVDLALGEQDASRSASMRSVHEQV